MTSTAVELARVAYRAYGETTDFLNFRGDPMPAWKDLGDRIQAAWVAAAAAVQHSVNSSNTYAGDLLIEKAADGRAVIVRADQSIAASLACAESGGHVSRADGFVTFTGVDPDGSPLQIVYREVGFNPTINPEANEGGFLLLERVS